MTQQAIKPPEYSPDGFVDREEEIKLVMDKARALANRRAVGKRTVIFIGERGIGKSWLLAHLLEKLGELHDLAAVSLDLKEYADWDPILATADILKRLSGATGGRQERLGATVADMSRNLMQDIRQLLVEEALVVLVDHVYESNWKLLAALEDYLLGPLAVERRVLIVMTGRGRAYPWKTPELRLKAEFFNLRPFPDETLTAEQLEHQKREAASRASEIHNLSGGNPLVNFLLAAHDDPDEALDQVVEGMLKAVPIDKRRQVRDYLEALCVLRSFDEERIPTMLAAYYDDRSYEKWSYAEARRVREELVKWAFARWDSDRGGYVLDEPTQKLVERYLKTAKRNQWEGLQRAASRLYREWADKYARTRNRWQEETDYHTDQLQVICGSHLCATPSY